MGSFKRSKKSSARRNKSAYKSVDPYWKENPEKLENKKKANKQRQQQIAEKRKENNQASTNKKLRKHAIKSLVKKHGDEVNTKVFKEEAESRKNKKTYTRLHGESLTAFRRRMQDDCDIAMSQAQMNARDQNKKAKQGLGSKELFEQEIRSELLSKNKIKTNKSDRVREQLGNLKNAKQRIRAQEKAKENVQKLDKKLETAEKDYFQDRVKFGERNDDIFRSSIIPTGAKKLNLESKKKRTAASLLLAQNPALSKHRQKEIADERQRVIDEYRKNRK